MMASAGPQILAKCMVSFKYDFIPFSSKERRIVDKAVASSPRARVYLTLSFRVSFLCHSQIITTAFLPSHSREQPQGNFSDFSD
jgi:hypothetical protein